MVGSLAFSNGVSEHKTQYNDVLSFSAVIFGSVFIVFRRYDEFTNTFPRKIMFGMDI